MSADDPFGVLDIAGARRRPQADVVTSLLQEGPPMARPLEPFSGRNGRSSSIGRAAGACELFDRWHEAFERAVRDPRALAGHADWRQAPEPEGPAAPTLAQLSAQGAAFPSLLDILHARGSIDQLIEGFDRLDGPDLLAFEPPADVLAAFAPELVRQAGFDLPGLTRREHHDIAPDSHVRIGGRAGDTEEAAT
ncbi:TagK domain-containing protein [Variovorax paradoxus]|uniref:TagK domain-containing protein n=1 Tax=Variovorax paradoxus TaxID=34073 RepID=UPI001933EB0E|nr:TagK domain-containing protein [Variovorax paradoxus]